MTTVKINNQELTNDQLMLLRIMLKERFTAMCESALKDAVFFGSYRRELFSVIELCDGFTVEVDNDEVDRDHIVEVNGMVLGLKPARHVKDAIRYAIDKYKNGLSEMPEEELGNMNALGKLINDYYLNFPHYPQLPHLVAVDDPAYEYRDMRQSDFSIIHIEGPASDNNGWRRETMEMVGMTGRMKRKKALPTEAALCIHEFDRALTVRELKRIVANWPVKNRFGEDSEVWISNGDGLSSAVTSIWPLNAESTAEGKMITADLMLQPYELTASREKKSN
jgi:hypothetical protein